MDPRLYILFGAPGSGKSEAVSYLVARHSTKVRLISKETTRLPRVTDGPEVTIVERLSAECDVRYSQYGAEYGFSSSVIWDHFSCGLSCVVIINDIRALKLLKKQFGEFARSIYIHANVDAAEIANLIRVRHPNASLSFLDREIEKRRQRIVALHRKYIENTVLFDRVILNVYDAPSSISQNSLFTQVNGAFSSSVIRTLPSLSRLFILVGASYSGKDDLVVAMQKMDKRVTPHRKATTRPVRDEDRGELRHFDVSIPPLFNITYTMNGHSYGISTTELWNSFKAGLVSLLVLSDPDSIARLKEIFGPLVTTLYLHADFDTRTLRTHMESSGLPADEINERIRQMSQILNVFQSRSDLFDHVLLNTAEPEDLHDQAFNILDRYCGLGS